MLKKIHSNDDLGLNENQKFFERSLFAGTGESSSKELDSIFGELKSGIIVTDDSFVIRYANSAFRGLSVDQGDVLETNLKITDILPRFVGKDGLVSFYEHLMTRKSFTLDSGFILPRIERMVLTPVSGGSFLIRFLVNELYTDSAANLLSYFPELPFAFCGFRIGNTKRMGIEFYSDNFPKLFSNQTVEKFQGFFDSLVHAEDLSVFLKQLTAVKRSKIGGFVLELRLVNSHNGELKWFRLYLSRYREESNDQLCIVYLQDINDERTRELAQEVLVNEIIDGERERMAMELHDGLGQQMVAVKLHLDILKSKFGNSAEFDLCSSIVRDSILQMKALCYNLAPPDFDKGLILSVERLFGRLNEFSLDIEYKFTPKKIPIREIGTQETYNILRIIQEFVSNSQKYSKCSLINCEIGRKNDKIAILLTDDGQGFDLKSVKKGFGLANMEKRAKLANAKVEFNSSPNEGTYLYLEV